MYHPNLVDDKDKKDDKDGEKKPKSKLPIIILIVVAVIVIIGGLIYWLMTRNQESTDDAYTEGNAVSIAPKVSGYIADVLIRDNEPVKAGQILAKIDDRDFRVALDQANADLDAAKAAVTTKEATLTAQRSVIDAAQATTAVDEATLVFAEQDEKRYSQLASNGNGSVQNAQQAASRLAAGHAAVARDTASVANATKQLEEAQAHTPGHGKERAPGDWKGYRELKKK